jgi:hypothetical protein
MSAAMAFVEQYHGLFVDVDDCPPRGAWTTLPAAGERALGRCRYLLDRLYA